MDASLFPSINIINVSTILLLTTTLYFTLRHVSYKLFVVKGIKPPCPPEHWLLGHVPLVVRELGTKGKHLDSLICKLAPSLGKLFELNLVFAKFVVVLDPDAIKEVVAVHNYPKSPTYANLLPFIGDKSLIIAEPATWRRHRTAFNPGFSYTFLKDLVPVFASQTQKLVDKLQEAARTRAVVPLQDTVTLLTMDIICAVVFSKDFGLQASGHHPLFTSFKALHSIIVDLANKPYSMWLYKLPWNAVHLRELQQQFDAQLLGVVEERQQQQSSSNDILSLAMATARQEGGAGLDREDLLSQVKTFLFAGHDTTATTISFAVYELSRCPQAEAKLVQELQAVLGSRSSPTAEDLSSMRYLAAVVKEVLRLWPPGGTARMAPPGSTLQGYDVGGKVLYVPMYPLHRDTELWGADAGEFRPERWLEPAAADGSSGGAAAGKVHAYAYIPFSKGPRDCIGQAFALLEAKTVLAILYRRFTFKYTLATPEEQWYSITSKPRYGVPVTVAERARD